MLQQILYQKFRINVERQFKIAQYEACIASNYLFILIPVGNMEKGDIFELEQISRHLYEHGDTRVCQFLKTDGGEGIIDWEQQSYCILFNKASDTTSIKNFGRKLAKFHYRGRLVSFELNSISRMGRWKLFWEQRLDQMERVWNEHLFQQPENEFERMFLQSFPYYMGLAENGIQYLMDTELDDNPQTIDSGTVCHIRFSSETWRAPYFYKNPFDWAFDHCSRDLAEWTRERYFKNIKTYEPDVQKFYSDYRTVMPLTSFSWRLLYARLLFPLHFFDCVESYYISSSEQEKHVCQEQLDKYLKQSREYEEFLRNFYQLGEVPVRKYKIPQPEWLKK